MGDPAALDPLPDGYRQLYADVLRGAAGDPRIRAMWLAGSLGRGVADAGSDLDVVLAVRADSVAEFGAQWRIWLAGITPTVLAKDLPGMPGSFYSLTPSCLRLDVVCEQAGAADAEALERRILVLDKDGTANTPAQSVREHCPRGPDPVKLTDLTEECLRQLALFPAAVVARQDWLLGVVGVQSIQMMLYQIFVEANQPLPAMGVKQWSAKLTPHQRHICAALPAPMASRDGVLTAMRAASAACRDAARAALGAAGAPWPAELDAAVQNHLSAQLGWTD